ncbi:MULTISPECIES: FecR family protein [unclassified Azospirillum]|uniref:FecR family protein n=1 Tax=unclassified Azospirillum TaxID=2630922 RepID=UPI000B6EF573|nr:MULTISPECIES: FecR family protein [unclassified Azospirillum]SNT11142.1 FecR family protein [Azospirillum sp. RU38E]SNT24187.1 FecR family protein [Azospirillum sp. RU37A]
MPGAGAPSADLIHQAAQWAAMIDAGDVTESEMAACRAWCAADPQHQALLDRMLGFNDRMAAAPFEKAALHRLLHRRQRRPLLAGAAALPLLVAGIWAAWQVLPLHSLFADYRTAPGEQRVVDLADGSRLTLDTDGAIDVELGQKQRLVQLRQGQILAEVAPARDRPFIVETPEGTATALGTSFTVRREAGGTLVTVVESHVRVCASAPPAHVLPCRDIGPGESVHLSARMVTAPKRVDTARATLWTQGWLEVDDQEVADVLIELNRYRDQPIGFDPSALRGLRVTGSFPLTDTDQALQGLARTARLHVDRDTDGHVAVRPGNAAQKN